MLNFYRNDAMADLLAYVEKEEEGEEVYLDFSTSHGSARIMQLLMDQMPQPVVYLSVTFDTLSLDNMLSIEMYDTHMQRLHPDKDPSLSASIKRFVSTLHSLWNVN